MLSSIHGVLSAAVSSVVRALITEARHKARTGAVLERVENRLMFSALDGSEIVGLPSDMKTSLYTFIGDHSTSNSEMWNMTVGGHLFSAPDFGVVQRDSTEYKKGETYHITVIHNGSNRYVNGVNKPDYDYRAWVDRYANPAWTSGQMVPSGTTYFVTEINSPALIQKRWFGEDQNNADGKTAFLHLPAVDLDIDSDNSGTIGAANSQEALNEDNLETDTAKGKWIGANLDNLDDDEYPDYADFDGIAGLDFVPVRLSLSQNVQDAQPSSIQFTFTYSASNPSGVTATSGPAAGDLRIWTKNAPAARTVSDYIGSGTAVSAGTLGLTPGGSVTLFVEAVKGNASVLPISVTCNIAGSAWSGSLQDEVRVKTFAVQVRSDADNSGSITSGDEAKKFEGTAKVLFVNDDDFDGDKVVDFADGFNWDGVASADDNNAYDSFIPIEVELSPSVDLTQATMRIEYVGSDPNLVTRTGAGTEEDPYVYNATGSLRLWTKNATQARKGQNFAGQTDTSYGYYVAPSGVNESYVPSDLAKLGFTSSNRKVTLYVEAIGPSSQLRDKNVRFRIDPDGDLNGSNFVGSNSSPFTSVAIRHQKFWSDQFAEIKVNGVPDHTGYEGPDYANNTWITRKPYVLMGMTCPHSSIHLL